MRHDHRDGPPRFALRRKRTGAPGHVHLDQQLAEGLAALGLDLDEAAQQKLLAYVALLAKWNRVYNLTAVREPHQMITRHILDSLVISPYLKGPRVLDVGSGAGLPGIPLAIAHPGLEFTLLDSSAKKVRFLTQTLAELPVPNATVAHARIEDYRPGVRFDTVIARAFGSIPALLELTTELCGDRLLAMKGAYPMTELETLPAGAQVVEIKRLQVPGLDAERHLVWVRPAAPGEGGAQ